MITILKELLELRLIIRIGKGKNTKYHKKLKKERKDSIYSLIHDYPKQPIIYYGLRGVGKIVLLTALKNMQLKKEC